MTPGTSQTQYPPDTSMYAPKGVPGTADNWEQRDRYNPYTIGDRVRFKGVIYESIFDVENVWSPIGWEKV